MRLERMYQNILLLDFEELVAKVENDSIKRDNALKAAMTNFDISAAIPRKTRTKEPAIQMSAEEKAVMKSLGLSLKDMMALINQTRS